MLEVLFWSIVTSNIAFLSMTTFRDCRKLQDGENNRFTMKMTCPDGYYHAQGALCKGKIKRIYARENKK